METKGSLLIEFTKNVCRGCLFVSRNEFYATDDRTLNYFTEISKVNVPNDTPLPQRLCIDCLRSINQFVKFKKRCQYSNKILSRLIRTSHAYHGQFDLNDLRKERMKYLEECNKLTLSNMLTFECLEANETDKQLNIWTNNIKNTNKDSIFNKRTDNNEPLNVIGNSDYNISRSITPNSDDINLIDLVDNSCPEKYYNDISDKFFVVDSLQLQGGDCLNLNLHTRVYSDDNMAIKTELITDFDACENFDTNFDDNLSPPSIKSELSDTECEIIRQLSRRRISKKIVSLSSKRKSVKLKSNNKDGGRSRNSLSKKVVKNGVEKFKRDIGSRGKSRSETNDSDIPRKPPEKKGRKIYYTFDETSVNILRPSVDEQMQELDEARKSKKYIEAQYKCHSCAKWYTYEHSWNAHLARHQESAGEYVCWICQQRYATSNSLRSHEHVHKERLQCKQCGKIMCGRSAMSEHVAKHTGTALTPICNICGNISMTMTSYYKHMRTHKPQPLEYKCTFCTKTFQYLNSRNDHIARAHTGRKDFICKVCNMSFVNRNGLRSHSITHSDRKDFYCVECDRSFKTKSALTKHLNVTSSHGDPTKLRFKCDQCDKRYDTIRKLKLHIDCTHLHIFKWSCDKCPAKFLSSSGLRHHRERIHIGKVMPKKHQCNSCEKAFTTKAMLRKHILTHTGEKPHACDTCGRPFRQKSALETHIKLVHLKLKRPFNKRNTDKTVISIIDQERVLPIDDGVGSICENYSEGQR